MRSHVRGIPSRLAVHLGLLLVVIPALAGASIQVTETPLTPWGGDKYEAVISGSNVAYTTDVMGSKDVYRLVIGGGDPYAVATGSSSQSKPAIDGNYIVYQDNQAGNQNIYLYDIATGETQMLTFSASEEALPAISGSNVVYRSNRLGNYDIYRYDLEQSREFVVASTSYSESSPQTDGNLIAWHSDDPGGSNVYALEVGGDVLPVAVGPPAEHSPDVSQGRIVYLEENDVKLFDFYSGDTTIIANDTRERSYPKISGNYVVWNELNNGYWNIYLYDIADGLIYQLTDDSWDQYLTDVDGNRAVYWDNRAGYRNIFMLEWEINHAPVANAGPDQAVDVGETVQLSGSAVDPDTILTFEWDWTMGSRPAGSAAVLSDTASQNPTFTADEPGTYNLSLKASDGIDWSAPDTVVVTVDRTLWRVPLDALTIQAAIDLATGGDTVEVATGTYTGDGNRDIHFRGKAILVRSATGDPEDCTVDCEGSLGDEHRGFIFEENEGTNSVLEGFRITGGYEIGGAGILVRAGGPKIRDCIVTGNEAQDAAGIQIMDTSYVSVEDCRFEGNMATTYGGGAGVSNRSTVTFERCIFIGNSSDFAGGGASSHMSDAMFDSCLFVGNESPNGGGLCLNHAGYDLEVRQCTFYGNSATQGGGIIASNSASVVVENTIIASGTSGAAVACVVGSTVLLSCSDLYGNAGGDYIGCVSGELGESGNISEDPLFCKAEGGDFKLGSNSPCAADSSTGCGLMGAFGVGCTPTAVVEGPSTMPSSFYLGPAVPNPFNPTMEITYGIPVSAGTSRVVVDLCDVLGRHVRSLVDREEGPGEYRVTWDGKDNRGEPVASGVYFYRFKTGTQTLTRKAVLLK